MKNPIIEGIETAIAAHKAELKKYEAMLALYNSGVTAENYNARRDGQLRRHAEARAKAEKRGPKPGPRGPRGPYKKKGKGKVTKAFLKKLESPDWNTEIPKILMGGSYTSREITEALCPGRHKKTMKVLQGRSSAYISNVLIPKGVVKSIAQTDGPTKYALA